MKPIREQTEAKLLKQKNVVGVGFGEKIIQGKGAKRKGIRVYVKEKVPSAQLAKRDIVPDFADGLPTDVIEVGEIEAQENTGRMRPAKCGISIGHYKITAGTLGCLVKKPSGTIYILSNNHVLANSNNARFGDAIVQPGVHDGGDQHQDQIARLDEFVKIKFNEWRFWRFWAWFKQPEVNFVDAALALPIEPGIVLPEILKIGIPKGVAPVFDGMPVQKTGRTTDHTIGAVLDPDVTVTVNYRKKHPARFKNQIMCSPMSKGGDSGSLIVNMERKAVGLLFAGSTKVTIASPIQTVLDLLGVEI